MLDEAQVEGSRSVCVRESGTQGEIEHNHMKPRRSLKSASRWFEGATGNQPWLNLFLVLILYVQAIQLIWRRKVSDGK